MLIRYVVKDARCYRAVPVRDATTFDVVFYRMLLERARDEILAAYPSEALTGRAPARPWDGLGKRSVQMNTALFWGNTKDPNLHFDEEIPKSVLWVSWAP